MDPVDEAVIRICATNERMSSALSNRNRGSLEISQSVNTFTEATCIEDSNSEKISKRGKLLRERERAR